VALAGGAERAVQLACTRAVRREQAVGCRRSANSRAARIGPTVWRAAGADADLEQVEDRLGLPGASLGEYIDIVPAQQQQGERWYSGTANAVYQNLDIVREARPRYVLVLGGDHVYKMDYSVMLAEHVRRGADASVACIEVPLEEAATSA
jgi:glucose-1-phosphate adenylyltransferase